PTLSILSVAVAVSCACFFLSGRSNIAECPGFMLILRVSVFLSLMEVLKWKIVSARPSKEGGSDRYKETLFGVIRCCKRLPLETFGLLRRHKFATTIQKADYCSSPMPKIQFLISSLIDHHNLGGIVKGSHRQ